MAIFKSFLYVYQRVSPSLYHHQSPFITIHHHYPIIHHHYPTINHHYPIIHHH